MCVYTCIYLRTRAYTNKLSMHTRFPGKRGKRVCETSATSLRPNSFPWTLLRVKEQSKLVTVDASVPITDIYPLKDEPCSNVLLYILSGCRHFGLNVLWTSRSLMNC